jgi:RND family efflux transporter MFP subunit
VKRNNPIRVLLISLAISSFGCTPQRGDVSVDFRIPVTVAEVKRGLIRNYLSSTGTVYAVREAELTAAAGGYLRVALRGKGGKRISEGDHVEAGQDIAFIESEELTVEHKSGISSKLEAYNLARQKYEQKKKLVDAGTISREELAQARSEVASSKYTYEKAVAAKAKSRIVTPISGIVVSLTKLVDGAMVSSGEKIATIMDYSKVKIVLDVTSSDIPDIKEGSRVRVFHYAYPGQYFWGEVSHIGLTVEAQSQTVSVEVLLDNKEARLKPGMFVRADILVAEKKKALIIPKHVVVTRNNKLVAFVVEKQKAVAREISLGIAGVEEIEITSGLREGERVVIQGYETLKDKTPVKATTTVLDIGKGE